MKKKLQQNKQLFAIILLLAALAAVIGTFLIRYYRVERASCEQRLKENAADLAQLVQQEVKSSQEYLEKVSGPVYDAYQYSEGRGQAQLRSLGSVSMISRLEMLAEDGTLYTPDGPIIDRTLIFSELARKGTGVTSRGVDQQSPDRSIIRLFVPVQRDGQTRAILFGVVDVGHLPQFFPVNTYNGQASFYLIEGKTSNFLIDAWHDTPGKLQDFKNYSFGRGYSPDQLFDDFFAGRDGTVVVRNPRTSDNYRGYYTSVGVQDWMVMLAAPVRVAFAQSNSILVLLIILASLMTVLSAGFLTWFLRDQRQRQARIDFRLRGAQYMLDVQQTLFRAHTQFQRFHEALDEVVNYLSADAALFFSLEDNGQLVLTSVGGASDKAPPRGSDFHKLFPQTAKTVMADGRFSSNRPFLWGDTDWQSARQLGVRNIMLVRLEKMDGTSHIGVLGAINTDVVWEDTTPLDQVALSFSMAIENYTNYQALAYMSQVDELTGVMNRNSYETRLAEMEDRPGLGSLGCIYIDANGLHEINNHLGHEAGDEMLRSVADALLDRFDKKDVFRLGGDEFAVLTQGMNREELDRRAKLVGEAVEKVGYSVSTGLDWQTGMFKASTVVASAEAAMRKAKEDFYASKGGERQMRNLNNRVEANLKAKRDADALLSALAPHFTGVYFVNPDTDDCRHIVSGDFFLENLKTAGGKFLNALDLYIHDRVVQEDRQAVLDFCNYTTLVPLLQDKGTQEMFYHRSTDGSLVRLQARQPRRAGDDQGEIMFLFSPISGASSQ